MPVPGADGPLRQAAEAFAAELIRLRTAAKLSQLALAQRLGYDKTYVTHLERCTQAPTQPVARQADEFFGSGETLTHLWRAYHTARATGRRQQSQRPTHQTPPRPAPAALHSTLPRDIAAFTGREGELHRLLRAAEDGRAPVISIHTVDGMAGVGKTALVTHAAHQLAKRYPDGHRFVDLHAHTAGQPPADPADVLATLLISIGISPQNLPNTLEERAALWRDRLAGLRMLLVLDNAASPDQVEPLLPASQQSLVLITSRRRLIALDGAEPLPLDTLPPDQAARLFTRLARRTPTDTDHSAVTEAVRLCGHLPLAITLLAARLAHHPAWDLTTFTDEFATTQDRLGELEASDRAVAAAFDLSYQDLPPHLQHLFRHLGLHPGPDIDPYATAALTNVPLPQARRHLETLYTDHLIEEPTPRRYRLHDLLREYAHTLTTHDPTDTRTQATHRLLTYYTHTAQTADHHLNDTPRPHTHPTTAPDAAPDLTTREQALAWMRTEHPNLIACAHHTTNHTTQPTHITPLAHAMAAYLRQQGPWDQALTLHHTAATTAHHTNDRLGEANALRDLGRVRYLTGDFAGAGELTGQALELFRTLGARLGEANTLWSLGRVRYLTGDHAGAGELAGQALELYRALGARLGEANTLQDLGRVRYLTGDHAGAGELAGQALELYRTLGNRLGEANALEDLGLVRRMTGDYAGASELTGQALELYRTLGDRRGEANTLQDLGWVRRMTGDYAGASELTGQALELYRTLRARLGEANTLRHLGWVRRMTGDYAGASELTGQALELYRTLRVRLGEANTLRHLGWVRRMTGDYAGAGELAGQALELYRTLGNRHGEANALQDLGLVQIELRDFTAATDHLARSRALFAEVGDTQGEAEAVNSTGVLLARSGEPQRALDTYQQALRLARQVSSPRDEAHALEGIARCQAHTDTQAAIISLREAVAIYQRIGAAETPTATEYLTRLEAGQA
ncbi:tetratricopeptide repeat protein [Streptomyces sp. 110]|uniref:Tetratricopeptide repeat protein n=1 Tax=Streptomyces endocoffeicus TaxID=2898945 RepID=A0ABS1Q3H0_9ACTN|nr:tetratricopeptide repeat protein [Streptomyces endocoffeicus]MBL1119211.1 tetratricopeptide repeat protein [Streptomyces endocoffeicus]